MKKLTQTLFFTLFRVLSIVVVGILGAILGFILIRGAGAISWEFLSSYPTNGMTSGGIFPAIIGTLYLTLGAMVFAFPIGVLSE
jgi:phosphate transport system permease protein